MALVAMCALHFPARAWGGEIALPDPAFNVHVASMKELRESRVVRQDFDFSCGSAAVATLLTFSYDLPTSEREAFDTMYAVGDQERIKKFGFSLLDMQKYLASRGLHAVGYKLTLDKLRKLHLPAIALISPHGYNHFVVVRGWRNNGALVADPKLGLHRMSADEFQSVWNGVVFVLRDNEDLGKSHFNDVEDFKLVPRSVVSDGMAYGREGMTDFLINIPLFNDY
jgi:hypothetical protein